MAKAKPWMDKEFLYDRYIKHKKTITQIAQECVDQGIEVTSMTIFNALKKFDLIKNSRNLGKRKVGNNSKGKGFYG